MLNAQQLVPLSQNTFLLQCKGAVYEINSGTFETNLIKFAHSSRVVAIDVRGSLIASI